MEIKRIANRTPKHILMNIKHFIIQIHEIKIFQYHPSEMGQDSLGLINFLYIPYLGHGSYGLLG